MLLDAAGREIRFAKGIYYASYRASSPEHINSGELPANFQTGSVEVKFDDSSGHAHTTGSLDWINYNGQITEQLK